MFYKLLRINNFSRCILCNQNRHMTAMGKIHKEKLQNKIKFDKEVLQCLYVNNEEVASKVVKYISNNYNEEKACIFDASPGIGLVTEKLLENGAKRVRVFEDNQTHLDKLYKLQSEYPDRLQIFDSQILYLPSLAFKYWDYDEEKISNWFANLPNNQWRDDPSIKFFAVLSPKNATKFLRFVIRQLVKPEYFFSSGRTQFIVFLSGSEFVYMQAKYGHNFQTYRSSTVLYNSLFDIEVLDSIPWCNFSPQVQHEKIKMKYIDKDNAYLVRLTPKLFLDQFGYELLWDYYYFVTQTFIKRKNWIIPFLEHWFPNCGPQLIKKGIPVFKFFGDLSPQQVFDLFLHFKDTPDYDSSVFKAAANERYSKFWQNFNEIENQSDRDEDDGDSDGDEDDDDEEEYADENQEKDSDNVADDADEIEDEIHS